MKDVFKLYPLKGRKDGRQEPHLTLQQLSSLMHCLHKGHPTSYFCWSEFPNEYNLKNMNIYSLCFKVNIILPLETMKFLCQVRKGKPQCISCFTRSPVSYKRLSTWCQDSLFQDSKQIQAAGACLKLAFTVNWTCTVYVNVAEQALMSVYLCTCSEVLREGGTNFIFGAI